MEKKEVFLATLTVNNRASLNLVEINLSLGLFFLFYSSTISPFWRKKKRNTLLTVIYLLFKARRKILNQTAAPKA